MVSIVDECVRRSNVNWSYYSEVAESLPSRIGGVNVAALGTSQPASRYAQGSTAVLQSQVIDDHIHIRIVGRVETRYRSEVLEFVQSISEPTTTSMKTL